MSSRPVLFPALLCAALLAGCSAAPGAPSGGGSAQRTLFSMDTLMNLQITGPQAQEALEAAVGELGRLDRLLDRNEPESDISRLNAHAGDGTFVTLDGSTLELLELCRSCYETSGGAFDCTIAPVMDAWGFGGTGEDYHVPSQAELDVLLPLVDSTALEIDTGTGSARLTASGMAVDLGGIAKGYAADRLLDLLEDYEVDSALLDLGTSTIAALGERDGGGPWRIALRDPSDGERQLGVLALSGQALSTSGGYERQFEENGVTYHHILDPRTGYPAETGVLSVTVVGESAAVADAWSTALFVLGPEEAEALWRGSDSFDYILCRADGRVQVTEGLEDSFTFWGDEYGYTCEILRR